ncbi:MAG: hypothetical protein L3K03_08735 [Thermoplasmata archaeon]|nr:hypothetical protein [Thermoplasmata archaeon]
MSEAPEKSKELFERLWRGVGDPLLTASIYFLARSELAPRLLAQPSTADELAQSKGWDPRFLRGVLHLLTAHGFLTESTEGLFRLTELGALLTDEAVAETVVDRFEIDFPVYWALAQAARPGPPVFERVHGKRFYEFLRAERRYGLRFQSELAAEATRSGGSLATSYDFSAVRSVVDVGGGSGRFLAEVLRPHPRIHGWLLDSGPALTDAPALMATAGVGDRFTAVQGSFFEEVPPGHDLYLLKWVLPDWNDEDASRILTNCARAMRPDSRLLILDPVVPSAGPPPEWQRLDLLFLLFVEGRLRSLTEMGSLLARSGLELESEHAPDPGFRLLSCRKRPKAPG